MRRQAAFTFIASISVIAIGATVGDFCAFFVVVFIAAWATLVVFIAFWATFVAFKATFVDVLAFFVVVFIAVWATFVVPIAFWATFVVLSKDTFVISFVVSLPSGQPSLA